MAYEAVEAFARGLMQALLAGAKPQEAPAAFIKPEDVDRAVRNYIDTELGVRNPPGSAPFPPDAHEVEPEQMDLIPPEMREVVRDTVGDLSDIPPAAPPPFARSEEPPSYDANMPGEGEWQVPKQ